MAWKIRKRRQRGGAVEVFCGDVSACPTCGALCNHGWSIVGQEVEYWDCDFCGIVENAAKVEVREAEG